jgi:hypothetical protein
MTELQASRTLVKSPPELWAECSDAAALARHLGAFGEIRITRLDPETAVAWEGENVRGTVRIEPAGWGTKVILTAERAGEVLAASTAAPVAVEASPATETPPGTEPEPVRETPPGTETPLGREPEPVTKMPPGREPEPVTEMTVAVDPAEPLTEPQSERRRRFARLRAFFRGVEDVAPPPAPEASAPEEPDTSDAPEPEPEPGVSAAPPGPEASAPAAGAPATEAALTAALDSLGQAHHRPYSRA